MTNVIRCLIMLTLNKLVVNILFIDVVREYLIVLLSYTVLRFSDNVLII